MSELDLTSRFKKTFFFSSHKKHLPRFLGLSLPQQEALVLLRERSMPAPEAFAAVEDADADSLLLHMEETVERIYLGYLAGTAI